MRVYLDNLLAVVYFCNYLLKMNISFALLEYTVYKLLEPHLRHEVFAPVRSIDLAG